MVSTQLPRILFVDDEPLWLSSWMRHLKRSKYMYQLELAATAPQAREYMSLQEVDVLVTDYNMPHVDGSRLLD
ncbi:MAG: hypothetical protein CMJ46_12000 [Planctomyces sp.]|nr:hypothetical protein [Planctomyces sp.]